MTLPTPTPKTVLRVIGAAIAVATAFYIGGMALAFIHMIP